VIARMARFRACSAFAILGVLGVLAVIAITTPAWARDGSRVNSYLRDELRAQGQSYSEIDRVVRFLPGEDVYLHPAGLVESIGGLSASGDGRAKTLYIVRLYNDTGLRVCVRAKGGLTSGPMMGTRSGGSIGYNFVLEPGSNSNILTNAADRYVTGTSEWSIGYYFWLPDPNPRAERGCSSVAPADVERWAATTSTVRDVFDARLLQALGR